MSEVGSESCPVCWREYSSFTKPFLIVCGHTFCQDCLSDIKNCPICRARIPAKYPGATNYSLLSMIERKPGTPCLETAHAETQTEEIAEEKEKSAEIDDEERKALALEKQIFGEDSDDEKKQTGEIAEVEAKDGTEQQENNGNEGTIHTGEIIKQFMQLSFLRVMWHLINHIIS